MGIIGTKKESLTKMILSGSPMRILAVFRLATIWQKNYFRAQRTANVNHAEVIETPADQRILISEKAVYPYIFAFIYVMTAGWLLIRKLSKRKFNQSYLSIKGLLSEAAFVFHEKPTKMHDRNRFSHPLIKFLHSIDGPTNCFPSLHVALAVHAFQILHTEIKDDTLLYSTMRQTCIDICRSTLEIKQHSIIDVIGGIELSRKYYVQYFTDDFEELLAEIIPELTHMELQKINEIKDHSPPLVAMLGDLKALLS